jgi:hypothetical protein
MMKNSARAFTLFLMFASAIFGQAAFAQNTTSGPAASLKEVSPSPGTPDPQIVDALQKVSPERIRATVEKLVSFKNRSTLSSNDQEMISQGLGVTAAAKWIQQELESYSQACGGCLQVKTDSFVQEPGTRVPTPTPLTNVYAILPGTDPENARRYYLVTGHYDSRNTDVLNTKDAAPGANDDASGTAVSIECARVLSQHKFPATLIFLTVAGEEQGLDGAKHFAKFVKEQGWDLEGVLNNDIVGGDTTPGDTGQRKDTVRVFSEGVPAAATEAQITSLRNLGGENDSSSRQLARYIRDVAKEYLPNNFQPMLVFRRDRFGRGGDHSAFNDQGFAAVRFTEYRENYNHQHQNIRSENGIEYGDLLKFVDVNYVGNVARVNAATLASLASAPAPPRKVSIDTRGQTNDSSIKWDAAPGATEYEVVWRATDEPYWSHAVRVPAGSTSLTLPVSKDNVVFAVRSLDAKGHVSLAVTPKPSGRIEVPGRPPVAGAPGPSGS